MIHVDDIFHLMMFLTTVGNIIALIVYMISNNLRHSFIFLYFYWIVIAILFTLYYLNHD